MEARAAQPVVTAISYTAILDAPESAALLREYAAECSIAEIGSPDPQRNLYEAMEKSGLMRSFGVYLGNTLAGFATLLVYILPHYGRKVATVESLFVASAYRNSGAGRRLMKAIEDYAEHQECVALLYSAPAGGKLERLLAKQSGCRRTNAVFTRSFA